MRLKPVFDTNIFGDVQSGFIPKNDWQFLLRHRPGHGWPLSLITVLELLAGLDGIPAEKFSDLRAQVRQAFDLSRGRVLDDPTRLLCREVLRIPFPADLAAPATIVLRRYMDVVRRATTLAQLLKAVPYKGGYATLGTASAVNDLVSDLKSKWVNSLEEMATEKNPAWRELFREKGRRLPPEIRQELEPRFLWKAQERAFIEHLLRDLLDTTPKPASVEMMTKKFDAVLEFTTFVVREFLTGTYSIQKHSSDVFDQFQLRYLAMDRFIIVTHDPDLSKRTARSSQAHRIMTFQQFLQTL